MTNKTDYGYTIVELLIAISLISLVVTFGYRGYYHFQQNLFNWQKRGRVEKNALRVLTSITRDLSLAREIIEAERDKIVFVDVDGDLHNYRFADNRISKDERSILDSELIGALRISYISADAQRLDFIETGSEIARVRVQVTVRCTGKYENKIVLTSAVYLRNRRKF